MDDYYGDVPTHSVAISGSDEVFKTNPIMIRVSREMVEDAPIYRTIVTNMMDRYFRPWLFTDQPALSDVELFPRVARWQNRWHRSIAWVKSWRRLRLHRYYPHDDYDY